jgi:hypothetical protein
VRIEKDLLTDHHYRLALKQLIEKHLRGRVSDYERLIEIVQNTSRQVPIRGVLEDFRRYSSIQLTQQELQLIDDLLFMYG